MTATRSYEPVECGRVTWLREDDFLFCQLPSGRRLAYPFPQIKQDWTPWGAQKATLTFKGVDSYTRQWRWQHTYGGSLVENITQAVARDLMAEAMLRCEQSRKYQLVLTVHDELIAEAPGGTGSVQEFERLMAQCPQWAAGCPIEASGWTGYRYHK